MAMTFDKEPKKWLDAKIPTDGRSELLRQADAGERFARQRPSGRGTLGPNLSAFGRDVFLLVRILGLLGFKAPEPTWKAGP